MKKIGIFSLAIFMAAMLNAQNWNFLGNNSVDPAQHMLGTTDGTVIPFRTNNIGRMVLMAGNNTWTSGRLGLGNNLGLNFTPQARLHLHQTDGNNFIQFTNDITGAGTNDGFRLGVASGAAGSAWIFQSEQAPLFIFQDAIARAVFDREDYTGVNNGSFISANRIALPLNTGNSIVNNRFSILNMGSGLDPLLERTWMNVGTTLGFRGDIMYTGLMEMPTTSYGGNGAITDAVIAWGCNDENFSPQNGPDNFRFIFINPTDEGGPPAQEQGKEIMRLTPEGNVGIGDFAPTASGLNIQPEARLHVHNDNDDGNSGNNTAVFVRHIGAVGFNEAVDVKSSTVYAGNHVGIRSSTINGSKNIAGEFIARFTTDLEGEVYGVKAHANGSGSDDLFGVYGWTSGNAEKAYGLYGHSALQANHWAAFVHGAGYISNGPWIPSGEVLKEDVQEISGVMDLIAQIHPKAYRFRTEELGHLGLPEGQQYGVIAEELQEVFPQFVREARNPPLKDSADAVLHEEVSFNTVNYMPLIPILTQGIKEQQVQIVELNARLEEMEALLADFELGKSNDAGAFPTEKLRSDYELYQNRPNPFSDRTEIIWRMAEEAQATIRVQDQRGSQVAVLMNGTSAKGLHSLEWDASGLRAGTYFYSLEVEDQMLIKRAIKIQR